MHRVVPRSTTRARRGTAGVLAAGILGLGASLLVAAPASAATFTVTSTLDDGGAGTLRAAIANANSTDGIDTISFSVSGTITLTGAPLVISDGIVIDGPGAAALTITRDGAFDLLQVDLAADVPAGDRTVTLDGLTLEGTAGTHLGRALFIDDADEPVTSVTLDSVRVTNFDGAPGAVVIEELDHTSLPAGLNVRSSQFIDNDNPGNWGGAIAVTAADFVDIENSVFEDNSSQFAGGAVYTSVTSTTVSGSTFDNNDSLNNRGGALHFASDLTVEDSTFIANDADVAGGAIGSTNARNVTITDSDFDDNASDEGGAVYLSSLTPGGSLNVTGSLFEANRATGGSGSESGGAIAIGTVPNGATVGVTASEFLDQVIDANGALYIGALDGGLTVDSSTFAGNSAGGGNPLSGSGIQIGDATVADAVTIRQSTFDEPGTAIAIVALGASGGGGSLQLLHSTVVGTTGVYLGDNDGASVISHSIVQGTGSYDVFINTPSATRPTAEWSVFAHAHDPAFVFNGTGNQFGVDPQLGALGANGGPTLTRIPAATSPAVNAGNPAFAPPPAVDQRGAGFPRVQAGRIDVGAVETGTATPGPTPTPTPTGAALPPTGGTLEPTVPILTGLVLLAGAAAVTVARRRRSA